MLPEQRDAAYLWDILQAAQEITHFVENMIFYEFENNKMARYAVERQLLVIGEAANHISESFKTEHSHIPWKSIIAQRNILAHEYGEILVERIWVVATEKIPELISDIAPLVPTPPQE
ncbi:MAG: DUF86 domain-containing protein [Phycisphaerae bacterium]|jgi:uncharacterized protein with HEPN domain|nr:DUF86 domain-containing protein [Phycisphaerae bacterium]